MARSGCELQEPTDNFCPEADFSGRLYYFEGRNEQQLAITCQLCGHSVVKLVGTIETREKLSALGLRSDVVTFETESPSE